MQQRPFRRRNGTQVHPRGHRAGPEARFSSAFLFLGEQVVGDGGDDDETDSTDAEAEAEQAEENEHDDVADTADTDTADAKENHNPQH